MEKFLAKEFDRGCRYDRSVFNARRGLDHQDRGYDRLSHPDRDNQVDQCPLRRNAW